MLEINTHNDNNEGVTTGGGFCHVTEDGNASRKLDTDMWI